MEFLGILIKIEKSDLLAIWEVVKNFLSIILTADYLAIILSIIALCLSIRAERRYLRKMDCKISVQPITDIYAVDVHGRRIPNPFQERYNYLINLNLINPSSSPMSYFALIVIDQNNRILPFPVQVWSDNLNYNTICCLTSDPEQNTYPIRLMLPPDAYSTLQSYTFLPMMLAINADPGSKITVCFRTCKPRSIKNDDPTSLSNYPLHTYEITLPVCENIEKPNPPTIKFEIVKEIARGRQHKKYKTSERDIDKLIEDAESKEDGTHL